MAKKTRPPILPANKRDPAGVDRLERGAMREFGRRIRKIARGYVKLLDHIPAEPVVNRAGAEVRRYTFRIDQYLLTSILEEGASLVDSLLADSRDPWFFEAYVAVAYRRGTAQAFANLAQQSPAYLAGQMSPADIMRSDPYRRRMALVQAREFEEMKNLGLGVRSAMSRILTDGIGRGLNPRTIARNLTDQAGIEARRANKIARTEVPMALRRARWDESDEAAEKYGLRTLEMHLSALSPTTRATHAARHGNLYTTAAVRDWYSRDGNAINCYLPGTQVAGRFVAGSKAQYRGVVVEIVTAGGRNLTVTPNHPVLTARGMVPAAEIRKGDYAVAYGGEIKNSAGVGLLHDQKVDSAIEHVFGSLMQLGHALTRGVVAVDFHGDAAGMHKDVDVVAIEGVLPINCDAAMGQVLDHVGLVHADTHRPHMGRALGFDRPGVLLAASRLVSGLGDRLAEFVRRLLVFEPCRVCVGSLHQAVLFKGPSDRDSGKPNVSADLLNRLSRHVPSVQVADIESASESASVVGQSVLFGSSLNGGGAHSEPSGQALRTLSGAVCLDYVVDVFRREYFGHVYDLQEISGVMVANGIISSNCKCAQTAVLVDESGNPLVPQIQQRALETKRVMREKHNGPWADEDE